MSLSATIQNGRFVMTHITFLSSARKYNPQAQLDPLDIPTVGVIAAMTVSDLRFQRQVARLCELGPRVVAELLAELGAERLLASLIEEKLSKYTALSEPALTIAGGHHFPPIPLHLARRATR